MTMRDILTPLFLFIACMPARPGRADEAAGPEFYTTKVQPLLARHCYRCHSLQVQKPKGGLRLHAPSAWLAGGRSGPAIVPHHPERSLLIEAVRQSGDLKMPPDGRLEPQEIDVLLRWVRAGARAPAMAESAAGHWAFQPVGRPQPPTVRDANWPRNPIDRFVLARLEKHDLTPAPEADRRTLLRRLSYDLLGLPPSAQEVERFLSDQDPQALEKAVDRLLASPHYGERWAQHWLDIAHYADTHGFERDQRRDRAWPYRDYVIRSLNRDKPYDQFIREQIAGDVLNPEDRDSVVATGFLAAGPWDFVGQVETRSDSMKRAARASDLDDMLTQVITATMGLTINCARCHDHKIDPISQQDYYGLAAVFAGVKRGDRAVNEREAGDLARRKADLESRQRSVQRELARLVRGAIDLADIAGGGNGLGSAEKGLGVHPHTGTLVKEPAGVRLPASTNRFVKSTLRFVDGVVVPGGGPDGEALVPISSTGLKASGVPKTSGAAWDAIRNGPVHAQHSTRIDGVDYAEQGHTLLSLHANAAITFDLADIRQATALGAARFQAVAGCGGKADGQVADVHVFVDGKTSACHLKMARGAPGLFLDIAVPETARFLTLMATDGGDGIGNDQVFFGDPKLVPADSESRLTEAERVARRKLKVERTEIEHRIRELPSAEQVFAVVSEKPPVVHVLHRGEPESQGAEALPGAIACVRHRPSRLGGNATAEGRRRLALADWIVHRDNPLTNRVIANRLWHHLFGVGLVETPSDFGLGGGRPSHPELLDWLADEVRNSGGSLKRLHRLIATSATYRQSSRLDARAAALDHGNRMLWRMTPRKRDAEATRDAVLLTSGNLNRTVGGPGYRDFEYKEEYAPVYTYITPDRPDLWRRSIYRFVVRTTPHRFLTTLDCPNPANLTPVRSGSTTALQALTLMNNDFLLRQSGYFAERVIREAGLEPAAQVRHAFRLAYAREPEPEELEAASRLLGEHGMFYLCRVLLNANEFVFVD